MAHSGMGSRKKPRRNKKQQQLAVTGLGPPPSGIGQISPPPLSVVVGAGAFGVALCISDTCILKVAIREHWKLGREYHIHKQVYDSWTVCNLSNELPRYVVNQVTAGAYASPQKVSVFLNNLYAAFRILNLRNDYLRKRFDGIKYDLKKVEEVLYDVKIRGLATNQQ